MSPVELGSPVRVVMTKWGDLPHWEFDAVALGGDEHGSWFGVPAGALLQRPGASFVTETDQVVLAPIGRAGADGWWVATFHAPGYVVSTYVDMTTPPTSDDARVHAVDLDLDVIRTAEGHVFVDDEDEFAEHRLAYGYPADVVSSAEASAAWVLESVLAERAPFDGDTSATWLGVLREVLRRR